MKAIKSPGDSVEVSPSQKKLKQARLPFKLISDVSATESTPSRKRKLSAQDYEIKTKVGKLSKENEAEELVVISDDDDSNTMEVETKIPNPFVKLVDTAMKKKLKKTIKSVSEEKVVQTDKTSKTKKASKDDNVVSKDDVTPMDSSTTNSQIDESTNVNVVKPESPKTPKTKKATKKESNTSILNSSTTSKHNESVTLSPCTPKAQKSTVSKTDDELLNTPNTSLTPKQLQKKLESAKKKEEREKEKLEREKKRQQEKEERDKVKKEKEDLRKKEREEKEEARKKEKEEKEEQRRKEKEEKDKQRELEKKLKEEKEEQKRKEREEKEEQKKKEKEAKDEEKRKKQEAQELEKQEQELKKKKAAEAFVNFFVPKQKTDKETVGSAPASKNNVLSSFAIKSDMRLAPTVRLEFSNTKKNNLENLLEAQSTPKKKLYVESLRSGNIKAESTGKTWPLDDKDDVIIIEDELPLDGVGEVIACESAVREKLRPKLLSFHENRRPPYWGTWRKKSAFIKPRNPFGQDDKQLDYEIDSDDEWEEEEGESIDGSAAGSDTEPMDNDEYEVDNDVFVPHGYLSDEEATMDEGDVLALSPEAQKARLKDLEDEFEIEMKKPTEKLKARLYGIVWETSDGGKPDNCVDALWNHFSKLAMIIEAPPLLEPPVTTETEKKKSKKKKSPDEQPSPKSEKKKKNDKESKSKPESKKNTDVMKNQLGINTFLTKIKST